MLTSPLRPKRNAARSAFPGSILVLRVRAHARLGVAAAPHGGCGASQHRGRRLPPPSPARLVTCPRLQRRPGGRDPWPAAALRAGACSCRQRVSGEGLERPCARASPSGRRGGAPGVGGHLTHVRRAGCSDPHVCGGGAVPPSLTPETYVPCRCLSTRLCDTHSHAAQPGAEALPPGGSALLCAVQKQLPDAFSVAGVPFPGTLPSVSLLVCPMPDTRPHRCCAGLQSTHVQGDRRWW